MRACAAAVAVTAAVRVAALTCRNSLCAPDLLLVLHKGPRVHAATLRCFMQTWGSPKCHWLIRALQQQQQQERVNSTQRNEERMGQTLHSMRSPRMGMQCVKGIFAALNSFCISKQDCC